MAEALARHLGRGRVESFSAGTDPQPINPFTIRAMADLDIDISGQSSKHVSKFLKERFDYVITVCDRAKETCPTWPGLKDQIHWSIDDPALVKGSDEQRIHAFTTARNTIAHRIRLFLNAVGIKIDSKLVR